MTNKKLIAALLLLFGIVLGVYCRYRHTPSTPVITGPALRVTFLPARFGNAIIIRTPQKKNILIDPGPKRTSQQLLRYMNRMNISTLSMVILTDPSEKRSSGIAKVVESLDVLEIIRGKFPQSRTFLRDLQTRVDSRAIPERIVSQRDSWNISKLVKCEVLNPASTNPDDSIKDTGSGSLALRIQFGAKSILLASDMREEDEARLVRSKTNLKSSVLAVARNGRRGSTSLEFLSCVRPEFNVIRVGTGANQPSSVVVNRLKPDRTGALLYRTDDDGAVTVVTDGKSIVIESQGNGHDSARIIGTSRTASLGQAINRLPIARI